MNSLKVLFIVPLLVSCAMEASEDMATEDTSGNSHEGSEGSWNLEPSVLACLPYYHETNFNGQTFVITVPAICPPEFPFDNILVDVDPLDEKTNPAEEFVNPVFENIPTPEQELIR